MWCSAVDTHRKLLDRVVSGASLLTEGVFECNIAHRRSVEVLCILHKMGCNPIYPLFCALHALYVPMWVTRGALVEYVCPPNAYIRLLAVDTRSTAGLLFPSQYLSGTILPTLCSIVWDWLGLRAGQCFFIDLSCSFSFYLLLFSIYLLSFYWFALWVWGLQTDRMSIAVSRPYIDDILK